MTRNTTLKWRKSRICGPYQMARKPHFSCISRKARKARNWYVRAHARVVAPGTEPAYSPPVAANSVTGRENPSNQRRNGAATALFCCVMPSFYGGRVGQASAWPGSSDPGFSPRHVRRPNRVRTIGDGSHHQRNQAHG